ncbi:MAG: 4-(cytidine 5'-diphospho)-2-C-methyl-D-erythritol kinase [Maritimibacter sp.]
MSAIVKTFAPAKVNLTLHVTGQRADGYHLLDSLVVFADVGDRITVAPASETKLTVEGPRAAGVPSDASNLVMKAAALFDVPVALHLSKHLPAAAGIGGGSSDAAATVLAMADLVEDNRLPSGVGELGADVRVCLMRQAARMRGIGEDVTPIEGLPALFAVLANPGIDLPTPTVFAALENKSNAPMPKSFPKWRNAAALIDWLAAQRNDLEAPARALAPDIATVLAALNGLPEARLARMSGSGATCFALFDRIEHAVAGAERLAAAHPDWWVSATSLR